MHSPSKAKLFLRVDLVEGGAISEMVLVGPGPTAERLINGEQRELWELARVFCSGFFTRGPVVVAATRKTRVEV